MLIDDIASIFVGGPIRTSQIVLELTERYEIEDLAATRNLIAELQGLGCRIAIDDVGTGHNGLSYILKLGVDIIKIDKMFVDAIRTEAHSRAIVDTLVDLARNLRMQIVAEGVENFEQVVYLRDHGISSAQGFVFSPPLPGSAFIQLIEAIDPVGSPSPRDSAQPGRLAVPQRQAAAVTPVVLLLQRFKRSWTFAATGGARIDRRYHDRRIEGPKSEARCRVPFERRRGSMFVTACRPSAACLGRSLGAQLAPECWSRQPGQGS